jgi:hypothetical protein
MIIIKRHWYKIEPALGIMEGQARKIYHRIAEGMI